MEYTNEIKDKDLKDKKKQEFIQIAMLIGMYLAIILMLVLIVVLVKNIDELRTEPVTYAIDKYDFDSCSCYDGKGKVHHFNEAGIVDLGNNNVIGSVLIPELEG